MSDDANQYWDAWTASFGDCGEMPKKLLCSWHIKRNWEINTKSKTPAQHHEMIRTRLDELMNCNNAEKFRMLLISFINDLRQLNDCKDFVRYFRTYYCKSPGRIQEWALWARLD